MELQSITIKKAENGCTITCCGNTEDSGYEEKSYVDDGSIMSKVMKHLGIEDEDEPKTFNAKSFLGEK